jgi:iron complex outermembrane receptor protein
VLGLAMLAAWGGAFGPARTADSAIVLTRSELLATGRTSLAEALQVLVPSLNFPRPSGAEWTDHVRPATLRGLGSDQMVVLVNGARLHRSALVHTNSTVARGQTSTDLDAVPLLAIERVEISGGVPDPRAGSGAFAGVINLVLGAAMPDEVASSLGIMTSGGGVNARNGATWHRTWANGGRLQLAGEYRVRGSTNRAEPDRRDQFFPGDPRNGDPAYANQVHDRLGDPETRNAAGSLLAQRRLGRVELTGLVLLNRRVGESAGLWRRASEDATVRSLYPTGFLPLLDSRILDATVRLAALGSIQGWSWEASAGYGSNTLRLELANTANPSLGPLSPTTFFAGSLGAVALDGALEVRRDLAVGLAGPVRVTLGAGIQSDGFRIEPGERDSYRYGGVPIQDGPRAGGIPPVGAQGYPGFMPRDSGHFRQESYSGYGGLAVEPVRRLVLNAIGRVEAYREGLGTLPSGRVAAHWTPLAGVSLQGALGAGYRVPSEPERRFSRSQIPVVNDVGLYDLLVPPTDPVAQSLGAAPLRAERSRHWGAGLDLFGRGVTFSLEYFDVAVRHRVVLTEKFSGPAVRSFLESQGHDGIGSVQFLANLAGTATRGVELRAGYDGRLGSLALRLDGAWEHHTMEITRVDSLSGFARQFPSAAFGPAEQARLVSGQPGDNAVASLALHGAAGSLTLRARRYGSVLEFGPSPDGTLSQRLGAKWLGDLEAGYRLRTGITLSAGVQNLLGTFPDRLRLGAPDFAGNSYFGIFPFSNASPFGFNGRFVYARLQWRYATR